MLILVSSNLEVQHSMAFFVAKLGVETLSNVVELFMGFVTSSPTAGVIVCWKKEAVDHHEEEE